MIDAAPGDGQGVRVPFKTGLKLSHRQEERLTAHCCAEVERLATDMGRGDPVTMRDPQRGGYSGDSGTGMRFFPKRRRFMMQNQAEYGWRVRQGDLSEFSNLSMQTSRRFCRQAVARAAGYFFDTDPWMRVIARQPDRAIDRAKAELITQHGRFHAQRCKVQASMVDALELAGIRGEGVVKMTYQHRVTCSMGQDGKERERVLFSGPRIDAVNGEDFLCDLNAADIHSAPFISHLYQMSMLEVLDFWGRLDLLDAYKSNNGADVDKFLAWQQAHGSMGQHDDDREARTMPWLGEGISNESFEDTNPVVQLAECYLRWPVAGKVCDIMAVVDTKNNVPIYYDYVANVTSDGMRPFEVQRFITIPGRWYGMGWFEFFDEANEFVDLALNRINFRDSIAGVKTMWNPDATMEGAENPDLDLNTTSTLRLKKGFSAADALSYVQIPAHTSGQMEMLQMVLQAAQNESGVVGVNDGAISGLDSTKLATGIRNIERMADRLFGLSLIRLQEGFESALTQWLKLLHRHLDRNGFFAFVKSDEVDDITAEAVEAVGNLTAEDVADLDESIQMIVTKSWDEGRVTAATQALPQIISILQLPPPDRASMETFLSMILKGLQIPDAGRIAREICRGTVQPTQPEMTPDGMPIDPAAQVQDTAAAEAMPPAEPQFEEAV